MYKRLFLVALSVFVFQSAVDATPLPAPQLQYSVTAGSGGDSESLVNQPILMGFLPAVQIGPNLFVIEGHASNSMFGGEVFSISIAATIDIDPFIIYTIAATNFTNSPLTFTFTFISPVAGGPFDTALASLSGSFTDDISGDGATVSNISQVSSASLPLTNLGVDLATFNCSGTGPLASFICGPFGPVSATFLPTAFTQLMTVLQFTLSPHDVVSFNGGVSLSAVPEPASLALLLGGGLLGYRRRRLSNGV